MRSLKKQSEVSNRPDVPLQAGVHPEQPGCTVGREAFDKIWHHSVLLLQRGFKEGGILTVDPEDVKLLGKPWTRRYITWWMLTTDADKQQGNCKLMGPRK